MLSFVQVEDTSTKIPLLANYLKRFAHMCHPTTIVAFHGPKGKFDSIFRTALFPLRKGVPGKFLDLPRLYSYTSGLSRIYGEPLNLLETTRSVRQGCSICPSLFNFAVGEAMEDALEDLQDVNAKLANGEKLWDLNFSDNLVYLRICVEHAQRD